MFSHVLANTSLILHLLKCVCEEMARRNMSKEKKKRKKKNTDGISFFSRTSFSIFICCGVFHAGVCVDYKAARTVDFSVDPDVW